MTSTNRNRSIELSQFSHHLFWDIDRDKIDLVRSKKWLIKRVLEYGLLSDWILISDYYGISEIAEVTKHTRDLDQRSISFISLLSDIPREEFLCYNTRQQNREHWNF